MSDTVPDGHGGSTELLGHDSTVLTEEMHVVKRMTNTAAAKPEKKGDQR